jgi:hypothetical protein
MTRYEVRENKEVVVSAIEKLLPEFVRACSSCSRIVTLKQEEVARDFDTDECTVLGMAIKYAGIHGKEVRILPKGPVLN